MLMMIITYSLIRMVTMSTVLFAKSLFLTLVRRMYILVACVPVPSIKNV